MDNIYHDYWEQELMYQFITEDKCRKKAYVCSPVSADSKNGMLQNMRTARAYMFYALKNLNVNARAPHAYLPMLLCDSVYRTNMERKQPHRYRLRCGFRQPARLHLP